MLVLDTETTGLLKTDALEMSLQPYITELYVIKTQPDGTFVAEVDTFIKPPVPISEEITKITGITNEMVADAPTFVEVYPQLIELFIGERRAVGHNLPFDMGMIYCELARSNLEFRFPWPHDWVCTIEKSMSLEHKRLKLGYLHELATGQPHEGAHRAKADAWATLRCFFWLESKGLI